MNSWLIKKLYTYVLIIVLGAAMTVGIFEFSEYSSQLNLLALVATLIVLFWYAYDTHRIAEQTIETNLRPAVLRIGFIEDWKIQSIDNIQSSGKANLKFITLKNIAKDIQGYVIKDKRKYRLLFGNNHTIKKIKQDGQEITRIGLAPKWGWLAPGDTLFATYNSNDFEEVNQKNTIYISYKDVEENDYFTLEDHNFSHHFGKND